MTPDEQVALIRRVCRHLETEAEPPPLAELGRRAGLSPAHLQRLFKRLTGVTPRQYADACRVGRLKARLKERRTVTTALYEAGYGASSRLYERAAAHLGMTPGAYRKGGPAAAIRYTIADSPLGRLLLAATDKGVCALTLGDSDGPLEAALRREYPRAELARDENGLAGWLTEVLTHLRGGQPHLDLPLDVRATAFQRRVWQALQAIPFGQTRTYQQLAVAVGRPTAVRAVARACATNPVSVIIPCHRAIRTDGSLAGYRWGVERKRKLLERERRESNGQPVGQTEA
jgi:AraC family transcriptional regulator of adaptative response/methylated-DNA-[protein]-cysteine methyltransferase